MLLSQARAAFLSPAGWNISVQTLSVLVALYGREVGRKPLVWKAYWCLAYGFAWGSVFWCGGLQAGASSQTHTALKLGLVDTKL